MPLYYNGTSDNPNMLNLVIRSKNCVDNKNNNPTLYLSCDQERNNFTE